MVILEGKNITKKFAGLLAVGYVDFYLQQGEILGLIGPNGAGKTTLVNVIAGVYAPSEGDVFFKGKQISGKKPYQIGRMGISRTFQIVKPFPGMTVKENAAVGAMYGAGGRNKSAKEAIQRAEQILEFVGLADQMNKGADQLSVASRKRLEMAKALAMDPELVLFDEVGKDNLGVLIDFGHSLLAYENPAESIALLARHGRLFHTHVNDTTRLWDDNMVIGSIHFLLP